VEREGQRSFFHNGVLLFSTDDREAAEERVHLPLLLHPNPQQILLIGGCLGGALIEVLRHKPSHVDCLEWDPTLVRFARRFLDEPNTQALANPRVSIIETDGRVHFRNSLGRYDLILMIAPVPKNAFLGRLLSVEVMEDARKALGRGGLFALATPGRASHFDQATLDRHSMLASTLALTFPYTGVSPGEISHFWGANQPVPESVMLLSSRLQKREIQTVTVGSLWLADRFFPFHLQTYRESLTRSPQQAHFELRPAIFLLGMIEDLNLSLPWLAQMLSKLSKSLAWLWGFFAVILGLALVLPQMFRISTSPRFAAMAVGASGMSIEILILFAFQTMYGHLYNVLGGIFALFMMGLVAGSYFGRWLTRSRRGVGWACAFASSVAALSIWALGLIRTTPSTTTLVLSVVAILAGMATAAIYAPAVACVVSHQHGSAAGARIYAFDLFGSAIAALIATWIIIPMLGLTVLALLAAMLCVAAALANLGATSPCLEDRNPSVFRAS
jgi:spermidine synthase